MQFSVQYLDANVCTLKKLFEDSCLSNPNGRKVFSDFRDGEVTLMEETLEATAEVSLTDDDMQTEETEEH